MTAPVTSGGDDAAENWLQRRIRLAEEVIARWPEWKRTEPRRARADSNIFIQGKNLHYGFDFCPAFWEWLIDRNAGGRVASIDKVGDELQAGGDDLSDWATAGGRAFFLLPDDPVVPALARVSAWLKQAEQWDYFDEWLARIRDIRV